MSLLQRALLVAASLFGVAGCGESQQEEVPDRVASTQGGAIVLSRDEQVAVAANRGAGVVTVFRVALQGDAESVIHRTTEIEIGLDAEPWAAVIGADDDTAYVALRGRAQVARITGLHDNPALDGTVEVGSEPTDIAITPSGARLFTANWGEGNLSVVTTADFRARSKVDLNSDLVATGVLGLTSARPALAHPRALAMTDDGDADDNDETLFITEFFSQPFADSDPLDLDGSRQGFVYRMSVATGRTALPISIQPVDDTGFMDAAQASLPEEQRRATGCFPNQLYAASVLEDRLYVTSVCASPAGPLGPAEYGGMPNPANFKTLVHPVVFAIDTEGAEEVPEERLVLTRALESSYAMDGNTTNVRMPLIPNDLVMTAQARSRAAYVTAFGADAVFRVDYDAQGFPLGVGAPGNRYTDLHAGGVVAAGRLPIGIVSSKKNFNFALVLNESTQNVSVMDLERGLILSSSRAVAPVSAQNPAAAERADPAVRSGRRVFATGLDTWSFKGQAWSSCESCHPDGLSDGVTWSFARGPRRTISTAGTYYGPDSEHRRLMLWGANIDEVHDVEGIVRSVSGGVGGVLWSYETPASTDCRLLYDGSTPGATNTAPCNEQKATLTRHNGLNASLADIVGIDDCPQIMTDGSCSPVSDWDEIDAYVRSVRTPRSPTNLDSAAVLAGEELFQEGNCAGCHGGPGWTVSRVFYTPGADQNGLLPAAPPDPPVLVPFGALRLNHYTVAAEASALNPIAFPGVVGPAVEPGSAPFRSWPNPATLAAALDYAYGSATAGNDQLNCALRAVGTYPAQVGTAANLEGIVAAGAPAVREVRHDRTTPAQGQDGFNVPSLLGVASQAPYFHAGNARTLEELFDPTFASHHTALKSEFLGENTADAVRQLVTYLLSIDDTTPEQTPGTLPFASDFCASAPQPGPAISDPGVAGAAGMPGVGSPSPMLTPIPLFCLPCGNGVIDAGEACDDGNTIDLDGCGVTCTIEAGFRCTVAGAACEECGNGVLESAEICDDGNTEGGDGCDAECGAVDANYICYLPGQPCSECGNGDLEINEVCDDGNTEDGDGCAGDCTSVDASGLAGCGDEVFQPEMGEQCDDGNTASGDGCNYECQAEEWCGNGAAEILDACDDGNAVGGDGCSSTCTVEFCGDGRTTPTLGEECDDGNGDQGDGCSALCRREQICPSP